MEDSVQPPFTIRIRTENNQDMDWMVKPDEVTFLQTLVRPFSFLIEIRDLDGSMCRYEV